MTAFTVLGCRLVASPPRSTRPLAGGVARRPLAAGQLGSLGVGRREGIELHAFARVRNRRARLMTEIAYPMRSIRHLKG
jgi:hypothetical protein